MLTEELARPAVRPTTPAGVSEPVPGRVALVEQLEDRLGCGRLGSGWLRRLRFWRKKYAWLVVVGGAKIIKRGCDIVVVLTMLAIFWPLFLAIAIAVKAYDRGPVLFWQSRVGRWGREFAFPKFRSMHVDAEARKDALLARNQHGSAGVTFKMKQDPRVTPVGRIIRRLSLDELPQVWCVLVGDMSLVGPRPPVPREVALYSLADRRRLDVTPGLTCIWQVSGRGDVPFPQQVELDVEYIESQSVWLDLEILLRTIPAVILGRGAY